MRRRGAGFTILEFVIALTLLALMGAFVFSGLRLSLNAYQKSQERIDQKARQRILEDLIRRQVGSLFPLAPTGDFNDPVAAVLAGGQPPDIESLLAGQAPLFYGTPESVSFITLAPLRPLQTPGLTVVRYGLAEDEWGHRYLGAMESRFLNAESFQEMVDIPAGKPLPLIEGVEDIRFEYYGSDRESGAFQWVDDWYGEERGDVPTAIRIHSGERTLTLAVNANYARGGLLPRGDLIRRLTGQ